MGLGPDPTLIAVSGQPFCNLLAHPDGCGVAPIRGALRLDTDLLRASRSLRHSRHRFELFMNFPG